jgi:hypothetical protein
MYFFTFECPGSMRDFLSVMAIGIDDWETVALPPINRMSVMTQQQSVPAKSPSIDHPICPKCGSAMCLDRIVPDGADLEKRSFKCPVCEVSVSGDGSDYSI